MVSCSDQQLPCRNNGVVSIDIKEVIVDRGRNGWHQNTQISACGCVVDCIGPRDVQPCNNIGLGISQLQTIDTNTQEIGRIRLCHDLAVVNGRDCQGGFGDVGRRRFGRGGQVVVAPIARAIGFGQSGHIGHGHRFAIGDVFGAKEALAADKQCLAVEQVPKSTAGDGGQRRSVIHLVGRCQSGQRDVTTADDQVGLRCQCGVEVTCTQTVGVTAHVFSCCSATGQASQNVGRGYRKGIVTPNPSDYICQACTIG